ncbi:MAG: amino acid-binding protein [Chthoniobacterales bacterium]
MRTVLSTTRATQLAISLVNQPGKLAHICRALAAVEVNIHALTVMETWGESSVVRIVVSDPGLAVKALRAVDVSALETEVLMIETDNKPGALAAVAEGLAAANINIEYAYLSAGAKAEISCMIVRPSDIDKAEHVLSQPSEGEAD